MITVFFKLQTQDQEKSDLFGRNAEDRLVLGPLTGPAFLPLIRESLAKPLSKALEL